MLVNGRRRGGVIRLRASPLTPHSLSLYKNVYNAKLTKYFVAFFQTTNCTELQLLHIIWFTIWFWWMSHDHILTNHQSMSYFIIREWNLLCVAVLHWVMSTGYSVASNTTADADVLWSCTSSIRNPEDQLVILSTVSPLWYHWHGHRKGIQPVKVFCRVLPAHRAITPEKVMLNKNSACMHMCVHHMCLRAWVCVSVEWTVRVSCLILHDSIVYLACVSVWRRWLPRRKLDPLGIDTELDSVKLTANNKANVCAAVQRAYDRAREDMGCASATADSQHTEINNTDDRSWRCSLRTHWHTAATYTDTDSQPCLSAVTVKPCIRV